MGENPANLWIAPRSITFSGGCRYRYHILGVEKTIGRGGKELVTIDLRLTDPGPLRGCAYKILYYRFRMYDSGEGAENVMSWNRCRSTEEFERFKKNPGSACASGVIDRYPNDQ